MFIVKYKAVPLEGKKEEAFNYVKGIFVVSRAADVDNFVYFRFNSGEEGLDNANLWRFEIEPVHDTIAEFGTHSLVGADGKFRFFYLENGGDDEALINLRKWRPISFNGRTRIGTNKLPPLNRSPRDTNEWDLFSTLPTLNCNCPLTKGLNLQLTAVTEQIVENFDNYKDSNGSSRYTVIFLWRDSICIQGAMCKICALCQCLSMKDEGADSSHFRHG